MKPLDAVFTVDELRKTAQDKLDGLGQYQAGEIKEISTAEVFAFIGLQMVFGNSANSLFAKRIGGKKVAEDGLQVLAKAIDTHGEEKVTDTLVSSIFARTSARSAGDALQKLKDHKFTSSLTGEQLEKLKTVLGKVQNTALKIK